MYIYVQYICKMQSNISFRTVFNVHRRPLTKHHQVQIKLMVSSVPTSPSFTVITHMSAERLKKHQEANLPANL